MKFRRKSGVESKISTSSMPDIIFMLLIFFMVTTVFKEKESKRLEIDKVSIKETVDLEKNVKAAYYWIGKVPGEYTAKGEPLYKTQLDDDLVNDNSEIRKYLIKLRKNPEFAQVWDSKFFNVFKVDKKTKMRLVREIQDELKEAEAFKVVYSVKKDKEK